MTSFYLSPYINVLQVISLNLALCLFLINELIFCPVSLEHVALTLDKKENWVVILNISHLRPGTH